MSKWICKWCDEKFSELTPSAKANHSRWCPKNPKAKEYRIALETYRELANTDEANKKKSVGIKKAHENGAYDDMVRPDVWTGRHHTEETKKKMSESRKKWIRENWDKHNWSVYRNKESGPEIAFREIISQYDDINIAQFYIPPENDRLFELDFADVHNKIAFEINGNQHYESTGILSEYYQNRHDYFVSKGWTVHEIHFAECYNADKINARIQEQYKMTL